MMKNSKELLAFSLYGGFIFSLIGQYWQYGVFMWCLGIIFFSFIFIVVLLTYLIVRKAVVFVYENYIKVFPDVIQEDEERERKKRIAKEKK